MKSQTALDPKATVLDGTVGKIAYAQAGTEGPYLILVHGCPGSRWDFRWWLSELSQWSRVIVVDMPGYGDATPTQFPATTAGRTAYLSEVLDTLDIDKAFVVSHSFGATAVVDFALRYPERVQAIALLAPIGPRIHKGLRRFKARGLFHRLAKVPRFGERAILKLKNGMTRSGFSEYLTVGEIIRMLDLLADFDFKAYAQQLTQLDVPAFVAHAIDDPLIEMAIVEELVNRLGRPRFHVLATGGHAIQKTMGIELSESLRNWAEEHSET